MTPIFTQGLKRRGSKAHSFTGASSAKGHSFKGPVQERGQLETLVEIPGQWKFTLTQLIFSLHYYGIKSRNYKISRAK